MDDQDNFPDNFDDMPQEDRKFKELDHSAADQYVQKYLLNRQEIYPHLKNITVDTLKSAVVRTEYTIPNSQSYTVRCVLHFSSAGDEFGVRGEYSFKNSAEFEYHTGCELAYLNAMIALIKYESFHLARVAEEKAKWLAGVEQDASSTFGSVSADCTDRATGQCCGNESIHDRIVAMDHGLAENLFCYIADLVKQIKKDSADMAVDRAAGQCVAAPVTVQPHQQRVIDEKTALDKNVNALSFFIGVNPVFEALDPAEQELMKVLNDLMWQLSEVLGQRIEAFGSEKS